MNQHPNGFGDTSRDLGAWAADVAEIPGVDEVSLTAKMVGMMFESSMANGEHINRMPVLDEQLFYDDRPSCRPVIGE